MDGLIEGALMCIDEAQVTVPTLELAGRGCARVFRVPGSFELPQACASLGLARNSSGGSMYSGLSALGCLIRGETSHYDVLCNCVGNALTNLSIELAGDGFDDPVPLSFGLLTCEDEAQATARSGPNHRNKGFEAMYALLGMLSGWQCAGIQT